jgi:hypothetical protein
VKSSIAAGTVETWLCDRDGDFSLTAEQWRFKAWLRGVVNPDSDSLILRIFPPQDTVMSKTVYAIYHARFVEMPLTHFDTRFDSVRATALSTHGDVVRHQPKTRQTV